MAECITFSLQPRGSAAASHRMCSSTSGGGKASMHMGARCGGRAGGRGGGGGNRADQLAAVAPSIKIGNHAALHGVGQRAARCIGQRGMPDGIIEVGQRARRRRLAAAAQAAGAGARAVVGDHCGLHKARLLIAWGGYGCAQVGRGAHSCEGEGM